MSVYKQSGIKKSFPIWKNKRFQLIFLPIILRDKKKSVYLHAQFEWGQIKAALLTKRVISPHRCNLKNKY